jgi:hypothetical protein
VRCAIGSSQGGPGHRGGRMRDHRAHPGAAGVSGCALPSSHVMSAWPGLVYPARPIPPQDGRPGRSCRLRSGGNYETNPTTALVVAVMQLSLFWYSANWYEANLKTLEGYRQWERLWHDTWTVSFPMDARDVYYLLGSVADTIDKACYRGTDLCSFGQVRIWRRRICSYPGFSARWSAPSLLCSP